MKTCLPPWSNSVAMLRPIAAWLVWITVVVHKYDPCKQSLSDFDVGLDPLSLCHWHLQPRRTTTSRIEHPTLLAKFSSLVFAMSPVNHKDSPNQDVSDLNWMPGVTLASRPSSSQHPGERDPDLRHAGTLSGHVSTQNLQTLSLPSTESSRQSPRLSESGVVSESVTARLANTPPTTFTPSPHRPGLSQTSPAFTTPTRNTRRPAVTPQQPRPIISSASSPRRVTTSGRKRPSYGGYSFPCLSALCKYFEENDVNEYRCIAKQTSGQCKNFITDVETLRQAKDILSNPCADTILSECRIVIRSLMCTTANHPKQQEQIESQWITRSAEIPGDTGSQDLTEPSPSQREIDPQDLLGDGIRSLASNSRQEYTPNIEDAGSMFCEQLRGSSAAIRPADTHPRINSTRQVSAEIDESALSDLEQTSSESPSASRSNRQSANPTVPDEEGRSKRDLFNRDKVTNGRLKRSDTRSPSCSMLVYQLKRLQGPSIWLKPQIQDMSRLVIPSMTSKRENRISRLRQASSWIVAPPSKYPGYPLRSCCDLRSLYTLILHTISEIYSLRRKPERSMNGLRLSSARQ